MSTNNILTRGGFIKIPLDLPHNTQQKIRLYHLKDLTDEKVKEAKNSLQEGGEKKWIYQGDLKEFEKEIKERSYLLKEGNTLQLIKGQETHTSEGVVAHHIEVSQALNYQFLKKVNVGGSFNVTGEHANIVIHLAKISLKENDQSVSLLDTLRKLSLHIQEDQYRQQEHTLYIEPSCVPHIGRISDESAMEPLIEAYQRFISNPQKKVLLLQAYAGSGKTMFTERLEERLLLEFMKKESHARLPLRIELGGLTNPVGKAIEEGLHNKGFSSQQIEELKSLPVVLILDGVDEARYKGRPLSSNQHLYYTNKLYQWKDAKVIFGIRVGDGTTRIDVDQFKPYKNVSNTSFETRSSIQECVICPFSQARIKDYIKQYIRLAPEEWKQEFAGWVALDGMKYLEMIHAIDGAEELSQIPFTLRILAEFLPVVVREANTPEKGASLKLTRSLMYEIFLSHWFQREKQKLVNEEPLPDEFQDVDVVDVVWDYCMRLANEMSLEGEERAGVTQVVYRKKSPFANDNLLLAKKWEIYFSDDALPRICRKMAPLKRDERGMIYTYAFLHPFLQEYLNARFNKIQSDQYWE